MCENCAYNERGLCYASKAWWKYTTPDGSCALYSEKEEENNHDEHTAE